MSLLNKLMELTRLTDEEDDDYFYDEEEDFDDEKPPKKSMFSRDKDDEGEEEEAPKPRFMGSSRSSSGNKVVPMRSRGMEVTLSLIHIYIQRGGEKGRRLGKGPVLAYVDNHAICTKTLKKSMFGMLNFI